MAKTLKMTAVILLSLLLVLLAGGLYLSRNLPDIVKKSVATYGPATTGTAVSLGSAGFNFLSGSIVLKRFVVGNPEGYKTSHAFRFERLALGVDLSTVLDKVIVIREFSIKGAKIIAEQRGSWSVRTNLQEIADHARRASPPSSASNNKSSSAGPKLMVKKVTIAATRVQLVSEAYGERVIQLPDMEFTNVGKKEGGLTPDQLTQRLTQLVTKAVNEAVMAELKKIAKEKGKEKLSEKIKSWFE